MLTTAPVSNSDCCSLWDDCLDVIAAKLDPHSFETWFKATALIFTAEGQPCVQVPNQFFADFIEEHFAHLIREALRGLGVDHSELRLEPKQRDWEIIQPITETVADAREKRIPKTVTKNSCFHKDYTFDKFVVGDNSRMAQAACLAVAEAPGKTSFNPLTIYGGTGLGKTHLLQAIGHFAQTEDTVEDVVYMTSQEFINRYMDYVRYKKDSASFYKEFPKAELLLIDDIHFFGHKPSTQNEFYRIFNRLLLQKKQIVLSSDRPPDRIPDMMERIISRFMGGLVADVQPPDFETRIAIIRRKAEVDGILLPEEVVQYIAGQITSNVRELEGTLIRLMASASFTGKAITLDVTREIFGDVLSRRRHRLTAQTIQDKVARHFDLSPHQLRAHTRKRDVAFPRSIAMYLCKKWTKESLRTIGLEFGGRDYSTVIHSCRKIAAQLENDESLQKHISTLDSLLAPLLH